MSIIKQVIRYIPGTLIPALLTLLSTIVFTKILTTSEYGIYMLGLSAINILTSVFAEWLKQSIARYLPGVEEDDKVINIKNSILISLFLLLVIILVISLLLTPIFFSNIYLYGIIVFSTIFNIFYFIFLVVLQSQLKAGMYSLFNLLLSVLKLIIPIFLIWLLENSAQQILVGNMLALIIVTIPMFMYIKFDLLKALRSYNHLETNKQIKAFFSYGLPMLMFFLSAQLLNSGDRFIISFFYSSEQVGIYSANYTLIYGGIGLVSTPFILALSPIIMKYKKLNESSKVQNLISKMTTYYLLGAIPVIVLIFLIGNEIVSLLINNKYATSNQLIGVISIGFVLWQLSIYGHKVYEVSDKTFKMMIYSIITAVVNIFLNLIFVPIFGIVGAAWATLISYLLYSGLVYYGSQKFLPWIIPWKIWINIFLALILGLIGIYLITKCGFSSGTIVNKLVLFIVYLTIYISYLLMFYWRKLKTLVKQRNGVY
ncbi:polysaccharide biosynthesis C-terminal domain-containing protein [Paenibacillus sp. FSL F4-0236]|uniref:lipopolysaccharide biosynthesis protein n=1 Tax=unclassified Paenibacillus TaxID=185978 RepID=UPI0030F56FA5